MNKEAQQTSSLSLQLHPTMKQLEKLLNSDHPKTRKQQKTILFFYNLTDHLCPKIFRPQHHFIQ